MKDLQTLYQEIKQVQDRISVLKKQTSSDPNAELESLVQQLEDLEMEIDEVSSWELKK